jgi:hypothetical protein
VSRTTDEKYLIEALDALEYVGCQFWACHGPTLRPTPMVTCNACATIARLRRRLGEPIRQGIEGGRPIAEAEEAAYLRRATHR